MMTRPHRLLPSLIARFSRAEDGAVTVDWVVIAAAAVGLAIALTNSIGGATVDHAERIDNSMSSTGIRTY